MSSRISSVIRGVLAAALLSVPATVANAADLIAPGPYVAAQPDSFCAREGYLRSIERRFGIQAREVHHRPELSIVAISDIRENRYEPAMVEPMGIDRLYCKATAAMSDGHTRTVWYLVEYDMGFAGIFGDSVEFCVSGLDRWNVYDGYCRVLR